MADQIFVRNGRSNVLVVRFGDIRVPLGRRGSRDDTLSLPTEAKNDPILSRWLKEGKLEEISSDDFFRLAGRSDAWDRDRRAEDEPAIVSRVRDVAVPMNPEGGNSQEPTVIRDETLADTRPRTPQREPVTPPLSTSEELRRRDGETVTEGIGLDERQFEAHELHRGNRVVDATGEERPVVESAADRVNQTIDEDKLASVLSQMMERLEGLEARLDEKPKTQRKTQARKPRQKPSQG